MREVRSGVWHWEAPHPEWKPDDEWDELVSSYAVDDGERLVLFDPLGLPAELEALATDRETAIVLTCPWHERDTRALVERLGAAVFVPSPEEGEPIAGRQLFASSDRLPVGVEAMGGMAQANDLLLLVETHEVVVAGDTLIDRGAGLEIPTDWVAAEQLEPIRENVRKLLDVPVEYVLATHGGPADRASLAKVLS